MYHLIFLNIGYLCAQQSLEVSWFRVSFFSLHLIVVTGRWSLASFICTTNLQTLTILGPIAPGPWLPEIVPWVCTWKNAESIESRCINWVQFYLQFISWCQGLKSVWVNLLHLIDLIGAKLGFYATSLGKKIGLVGPKALTAISCGRSTGATRSVKNKMETTNPNVHTFK